MVGRIVRLSKPDNQVGELDRFRCSLDTDCFHRVGRILEARLCP